MPCKYTIKTKQKKLENEHTKKNNKKIQQNTVCLEQQIYASQEYFTQPLVVMGETFRRSACAGGQQENWSS